MSKQQPTQNDLYQLARYLACYIPISHEESKQYDEKLRFRIGNEYFYFLLPADLPGSFVSDVSSAAPGLTSLDLLRARPGERGASEERPGRTGAGSGAGGVEPAARDTPTPATGTS
jgi:hypothetical protein